MSRKKIPAVKKRTGGIGAASADTDPANATLPFFSWGYVLNEGMGRNGSIFLFTIHTHGARREGAQKNGRRYPPFFDMVNAP
jgi:hypothetical protein